MPPLLNCTSSTEYLEFQVYIEGSKENSHLSEVHSPPSIKFTRFHQSCLADPDPANSKAFSVTSREGT